MFVSGQADVSKLTCMVVGRKVVVTVPRTVLTSDLVLPTANATIQKQEPLAGEKLPFAVIPLERMNVDQMKQALKDRGYSIEQETSIQSTKHANLIKTELLKLQKEDTNVQTKLRNTKANITSKDLYLSMDMAELILALGKCNSKLRTTGMRRHELTLLLDSCKYQGGGSANAQLIHFQAETARIATQIEDAKARIASLSAVSQNYDQNPRVGEKRPIAKVD